MSLAPPAAHATIFLFVCTLQLIGFNVMKIIEKLNNYAVPCSNTYFMVLLALLVYVAD